MLIWNIIQKRIVKWIFLNTLRNKDTINIVMLKHLLLFHQIKNENGNSCMKTIVSILTVWKLYVNYTTVT